MKMDEFIKKLERELGKFSPSTRAEIIADYEEHFRNGRERGRTDEDICNKLGSPQEIARSYAAEKYLEQAQQAQTLGGKINASIRALLAVFGLGFFNLVFIIGPYFGLIGALIGLWCASFTVVISGATLTFVSAFLPNNISFNWWQMEQCLGATRIIAGFGGMGTVCFGLLFAIAMSFVTKWFIKFTLWYVHLNVKIVKK